jgi:hypothetical protein
LFFWTIPVRLLGREWLSNTTVFNGSGDEILSVQLLVADLSQENDRVGFIGNVHLTDGTLQCRFQSRLLGVINSEKSGLRLLIGAATHLSLESDSFW